MKAYKTIFRTRLRSQLMYRFAMLAGSATNLFFGIVKVAVFAAFYRQTTEPQPLSLQQVDQYIWLSQAFFPTIPMWVDAQTRQLIAQGNVAYEILRPIDMYGYWFVRALAARTGPVMTGTLVTLFACFLFFDLHTPVAPLLSLLSFGCAFLLGTAIIVLLSISMFWTISSVGASQLIPPIIWFCSGLVVPIPLMPPAMQQVVRLLPFDGLIDIPCRVYFGEILGVQAYFAIAKQVVWTVALVALGRVAMSRAFLRLTIQGG